MPWPWPPTSCRHYTPPARSRVPITPRAGIGGHGTEAPRGICWHQYRTEADGTIASARIIPPTSQNQATIEAGPAAAGPARSRDLPDEQAALRCEHLIRNYDPCISCSVHFLKLDRIPADAVATPNTAEEAGHESAAKPPFSSLHAATRMAGDDAFGPLLAESLQRSPLRGVEAADLGMNPGSLLDLLDGRLALVIADAAVVAGAAPGHAD